MRPSGSKPFTRRPRVLVPKLAPGLLIRCRLWPAAFPPPGFPALSTRSRDAGAPLWCPRPRAQAAVVGAATVVQRFAFARVAGACLGATSGRVPAHSCVAFSCWTRRAVHQRERWPGVKSKLSLRVRLSPYQIDLLLGRRSWGLPTLALPAAEVGCGGLRTMIFGGGSRPSSAAQNAAS